MELQQDQQWEKSAFALNIATNAAVRARVPVAIFSLEMSKEQMGNRILCSEAMVDSNKVRTGRVDDEDWAKLAGASGELSESEIFMMIRQEFQLWK